MSLSLLSNNFFSRFLGLNSVFCSRLSFSSGLADSRNGRNDLTASHCLVGRVTSTAYVTFAWFSCLKGCRVEVSILALGRCVTYILVVAAEVV